GAPRVLRRDGADCGEGPDRALPGEGPRRGGREDTPAAARARGQAGGPGHDGTLVIGFRDGWLDPDPWRAIENCVALHRTPSSNGLARALIEMYFEEGQDLRTTALIAESQPRAYGRNGRAWAAPEGQGPYLTIAPP